MFTQTMLAVIRIADGDGPAPEDVKAGWVALIIFLLLALSVAFLGWSLTKQLRKAQAAKDSGAFGDEPAVRDDAPANGDSSTPV